MSNFFEQQVTADYLELTLRCSAAITYYFSDKWSRSDLPDLHEISIRDVASVSADEWLRLPNFGKTSLKDLQFSLAAFGYSVGNADNPVAAFKRAIAATRRAITKFDERKTKNNATAR